MGMWFEVVCVTTGTGLEESVVVRSFTYICSVTVSGRQVVCLWQRIVTAPIKITMAMLPQASMSHSPQSRAALKKTNLISFASNINVTANLLLEMHMYVKRVTMATEPLLVLLPELCIPGRIFIHSFPYSNHSC